MAKNEKSPRDALIEKMMNPTNLGESADDDLADSFLQFAKSHMEQVNRESEDKLYRKELEEIDRYLKDPAALKQDLDRIGRQRSENFSTDPNMGNPEYRAAKEQYEHYVQRVEAGEYEDRDQMIGLYEALLESVPARSLLAEKIQDEIDAHMCDKMTDMF